ncbi:transcription elongation factor GreB [Fluviicoccus keumensis]|uniref:Transcription elongation factor GreB n=1 Tax=Fluviicoccus keumensis TaxID=1435465 RepID=A0A4Q7Z5I9_9GAMM|nr:transcription elongation factor GreB [Fluviicoccus keumensis]RZU44963.1 transcription elongation factor GreB [Fluviicoccus keumensis]
MSRYRPPSAPKTPLITPEGYQTLADELDYLWRVKRPEVTRSVSEAAAQGDRSENAEYIYGKKLLREIDRRVRFLEKRLPELRVVREKPSDPSRIFFGAIVELEDLDTGEELQLRIVGPDEIDPKRNWISIDAPMARALLKKTIDDEVPVERPAGKAVFLVVDVRYGENQEKA